MFHISSLTIFSLRIHQKLLQLVIPWFRQYSVWTSVSTVANQPLDQAWPRGRELNSKDRCWELSADLHHWKLEKLLEKCSWRISFSRTFVKDCHVCGFVGILVCIDFDGLMLWSVLVVMDHQGLFIVASCCLMMLVRQLLLWPQYGCIVTNPTYLYWTMRIESVFSEGQS